MAGDTAWFLWFYGYERLCRAFLFSVLKKHWAEFCGRITPKSWGRRVCDASPAHSGARNRVQHTLLVQVIPHKSWAGTENLPCPQSLCCNLSPCIYLPTCRHSCCRGFRDLLLQRSKMLLPAIPLIWRRASITQLMASRHNSSITFSYWLFLSTLPCNEDLCLLTFTQRQHQLSPNPATHKNGKIDAGKH